MRTAAGLTDLEEPPMCIVCYGDSNTYGYDPRGYLGGRYEAKDRWVDILAEKTKKSVKNAGLNGREIPRIGINLPCETELLIIMLGTNDVLQGADSATVISRMAHFLDQITLSCEKILLIAPPHLQPGSWVDTTDLIEVSRSLATGYQQLAAEKHIRFTDAGVWDIPLAFDGVHFTEEGHRTFARRLSALLDL